MLAGLFIDSNIILITYFFWTYTLEHGFTNIGNYEDLKLTYFVFISSFIILFRFTAMLRSWEYKNVLFDDARLSRDIKEQRLNNQILQNELIRLKIELAKQRLNK